MLCFVMMCAVLNGTFISLASFKSKWWMKIESKKKYAHSTARVSLIAVIV